MATVVAHAQRITEHGIPVYEVEEVEEVLRMLPSVVAMVGWSSSVAAAHSGRGGWRWWVIASVQ